MLCSFLLYIKVARICILFCILFHYSLSLDIESNSLCYTVGPSCLHILCVLVYICQTLF